LERELGGEVDVMIASNPCFGLEFAAIAQIHTEIMVARNRGAAVLLVSEDLDELLELTERDHGWADMSAAQPAGALLPTASHVPSVVWRLDETIGFGDGRIPENMGVISRIDAVQAARHHKPTSVVPIILPRQCRGRRAEDDGCREGNPGFDQHFVSPVCLMD
jgi:hypothetical protein